MFYDDNLLHSQVSWQL